MSSFDKTVRTKTAVLPGTEDAVGVQLTSFTNKLVVFVRLNGEMDTSYRIPMPTETILGNMAGLSDPSNPDDLKYDREHGLDNDVLDQTSKIEPVCILGDSSNYKMRVVCCQLALLLITSNKDETRDIILTASSKLFRGQLKDNDFETLYFVMGLVKECYGRGI